jgi:hypothetical protein
MGPLGIDYRSVKIKYRSKDTSRQRRDLLNFLSLRYEVLIGFGKVKIEFFYVLLLHKLRLEQTISAQRGLSSGSLGLSSSLFSSFWMMTLPGNKITMLIKMYKFDNKPLSPLGRGKGEGKISRMQLTFLRLS